MQSAGDRPAQNDDGHKIIEMPDRGTGTTETIPAGEADESMKQAKLNYDLRKIREAVENAPDVREEKVALIKKMIASGEYSVQAREIADKMLHEFLLDDALKR